MAQNTPSEKHICQNCMNDFMTKNTFKHKFSVEYNKKCDKCKEDVLFVYVLEGSILSLFKKYYRSIKLNLMLKKL
jgi:hypothetical protein